MMTANFSCGPSLIRSVLRGRFGARGRWRSACGVAAGVLIVAMISACASPASSTRQAPATESADRAAPMQTGGAPDGPAFVLAPGDEVDIRYGDSPQFDQTTRIRPDGFISVPYIGTLKAAGLSPEALQAALQERHLQLARSTDERRYLLQAGDEIELKFANAPAVNDFVRIRPDGQLQLQLIGTVRAAGMTPEQLRVVLRNRYAQYLRKPELAVIVRNTITQTVFVGDRPMRAGTENLRPVVLVRTAAPLQVFVGGEVARPGVLAYRPGLTVMQATIEAGGRLPAADLTRVVVLRRQNNAPLVIERDLGAILVPDRERDAMARSASQDVVLQPSDVVIFPQTKVAGVAELLNEYVFKNVPFIRNSSFSFSYLFGRNEVLK